MSVLPVPDGSVIDYGRASRASARRHVPSRWSRKVATDIVAFFEASAIIAGAFVPALLFEVSATVALGPFGTLRVSIFAAIFSFLLLRAMAMYPRNEMNNFPLQPGKLFLAVLLPVAAVSGIGLPLSPGTFITIVVWSLSWIAASYLLMLIMRNTARWVLQSCTHKGYFDKQIAVFGAGEIARRVAQFLENKSYGITLAGIYDDREEKDRLDDKDLTLAGKLNDLIAAGRQGRIDEIVIALPQAAQARTHAIVQQLEQLPVSIHVVTHIASDMLDDGATHSVSNIGPVGLLGVKRKPLSDWAPLFKTLEDYTLAALFLVLSSPLLLIIAALIKLESPGPVFFRQHRRGFNHQTIEVLKFRTMNVLENGPVVTAAVKDDPRVTRVGRWLRRTSLDELPQLINVLRGEMSIVGPRPHAIAHDNEWLSRLQIYTKRFQVKPGITGLAQVRGLRGLPTTDFTIEDRVRNDLEYITNWSIWLDLRIIVQTIRTVITGLNAH